jgi:hypothetical protein
VHAVGIRVGPVDQLAVGRDARVLRHPFLGRANLSPPGTVCRRLRGSVWAASLNFR